MAHKVRWLSMLALVATVAVAPACASDGYLYAGDRPYAGYGGYGAYRGYGAYMGEVRRIAHQNGYHEGREAGEKDGRRRRSFSFDRHDD